jgi:hypothetical protein
MLRKFAIAAAAAATLAACSSVITPGTSQIDQVRQYAVTACGFLPTVETVANIIGTFSGGAAPAITSVSQVADAICSAVLSTGGTKRSRAAAPRVNGVVVQGTFVR